MGSCISKCRSKKKKLKEDCSHIHSHVHDKLVISQDPPISSIPKMPLERPHSPAPSTSTFSSFSCSSNNSKCSSTMASSISSSSSSLSSSSCSSSVLSMKDRSFSNEFLWSCVKDNPHIVGLIKEKGQSHYHNLDQPSLLSSPNIAPIMKHPMQEKAMITPKKRARASSPTLVRQKSFRKEQNSVSSMPNRALRSPSPTRRINGDNSTSFSTNGMHESYYKRPVISKVNAVTSGLRRESFRAPIASPNRDLLVRKKDVVSQQISTKIDARAGVEDIKCSKKMDVVMEDINNPLIALDCFIFL